MTLEEQLRRCHDWLLGEWDLAEGEDAHSLLREELLEEIDAVLDAYRL